MISRRIFFVLLSALSLALLFAWSRIHIIELGYEVSKLKSEVETIARLNGVLKSQVARAQSMEELLKLSAGFNMQSPSGEKVLFVPEE